MKTIVRIIAATVLSCGLGAASAESTATSASVFLRAEPGSYVGYGLPTAGATLVHGVDTVFRSFDLGDQSAYIYTSGDRPWSFQFAAADYSPIDDTAANRPLQVGFYDDATRFPYNSSLGHGMDVSGNYRGYNQLSGWFNVLEVTYSASFELETLAVDFAEYGESGSLTWPALYGSLRYNSAIPLTTNIPEPSMFALLLVGLSGMGFVALRKRRA